MRSFLLAALVSVLDSLAFWVVIICGLYLLYIITVLSNEVNSPYGGISNRTTPNDRIIIIISDSLSSKESNNRIDHKMAAEHPHTRQA